MGYNKAMSEHLEFNTWSGIVLAVLAAQLILYSWLSRRQIRCVRAHRGNVPAAFSGHINPEQHQKAADYTCDKVRLNTWDMYYGAVLFLVFTYAGGLAALENLWAGTLQSQWLLSLAFLFSIYLAYTVLEMPLSLMRVFGIEERHGFNRMTYKLYLTDLGKQMLLTIIIGGITVSVALWVMQLADRLPYWWLLLWALWMALQVFISWAYPAFIAPWFNRFRPLPDGDLKERITHLLTRNGFTSNGIFVMDGSARSTHGNAYFAGFGKTKRIVFFDTLINQLDTSEIEAVLAHELGHYKCNHVKKRIIIMALLGLALCWLLGLLYNAPWFYHGLGTTQSPQQALALITLVAPLFTTFLQPAFSHLSRQHEFEADDFAVAQTPVRSMRQALVKLYRDNASTLTPDRWYSFFHDSHPPAPVRIGHLELAEAAGSTR